MPRRKIKKTTQKSNRTAFIERDLAAQRGSARAQHFASGGTLAGYWGNVKPTTTKNRKRVNARRACRNFNQRDY